jgi:hypothetical protein
MVQSTSSPRLMGLLSLFCLILAVALPSLAQRPFADTTFPAESIRIRSAFLNRVQPSGFVNLDVVFTDGVSKSTPLSAVLRNDAMLVSTVALREGIWMPPGVYRFELNADGCSTQIVDSVTVIADTVTGLTVRLYPGSDTIRPPAISSNRKSVYISRGNMGDLVTGLIIGSVRDLKTNSPISGVRLRMVETGDSSVTDELGRFALDGRIAGELLHVSFHCPGSDSVMVPFAKMFASSGRWLGIRIEQKNYFERLFGPKRTGLILVATRWSNIGLPGHEGRSSVMAFDVEPGQGFGPASPFLASGSPAPFRVVNVWSDGRMLLRLSKDFRLTSITPYTSQSRDDDYWRGRDIDTVTVTDNPVRLSETCDDCGTVVTLQIK